MLYFATSLALKDNIFNCECVSRYNDECWMQEFG